MRSKGRESLTTENYFPVLAVKKRRGLCVLIRHVVCWILCDSPLIVRYEEMAVKKEQKFVIKNPEADMTKGQSYALYSMTGVDVRQLDLNKGKASVLIDACNDGQCKAVRLALTDAGGEVKTRDVHKNFRAETNPKGYKPKAAPKAKPKAKKAAPESEEGEEVGLTTEAMMKLAAEDPAQLIALLTGKPLPKPEPKPKAKTQPKKKKPAAKTAPTLSGDIADSLAELLASEKTA